MPPFDERTTSADAIRLLLGDEEDEETWAAFVPWLVHEADPDARHRVVMGSDYIEGVPARFWPEASR